MLEAVKGVVWDHSAKMPDGVNKYVVILCLVTDKPIEMQPSTNSSDIESEHILCGRAFGLSDAIGMVQGGECPYRLGDATAVLMSLNDITPATRKA